MSVFTCPVCGAELNKNDRTYACPNGHSFDAAASGYVNLMPTGKPHANAGDNAEMMAARSTFLSAGFYSCLRNKLAETVAEALKNSANMRSLVIDAGCGEGYYTVGIADYLKNSGISADVAGIDVSKRGIKYASKRSNEVFFAVAGIFSLPFADCSADAVVNIFAPVCEAEFSRVLRPGGSLFIVGPGKNHLMGLKSIVYDTPYLNEENVYDFKDFEKPTEIRVHDDITVSGENIHNLFTMTPYYYNTPLEEAKRLEGIPKLETSIDFVITVLKKK